jgi:hypothetical protein
MSAVIQRIGIPDARVKMKNRYLAFLAFVWLTLVGIGMGCLLRYSYRPGDSANSPPDVWPAAVNLPTVQDRPNLVMFLHPKCPCSRASVDELAVLLTRCQNRLNALVLLVDPPGAEADWTNSTLRHMAETIPGVTVLVDKDGKIARDFHATTSGHVMYYDETGRLRFAGGITDARGHEGDNAGLSYLINLAHNRDGRELESTPVFGCSLWNGAGEFQTTNTCKPQS